MQYIWNEYNQQTLNKIPSLSNEFIDIVTFWPLFTANPVSQYLFDGLINQTVENESQREEIKATKTAIDEFFSGNIFYEPIFTKDAIIHHYNPVYGFKDDIIFMDPKIRDVYKDRSKYNDLDQKQKKIFDSYVRPEPNENLDRVPSIEETLIKYPEYIPEQPFDIEIIDLFKNYPIAPISIPKTIEEPIINVRRYNTEPVEPVVKNPITARRFNLMTGK